MSLGSIGSGRRRAGTNGVLGGAVAFGAVSCSDITDDPNSYDSAGNYTASARRALTTCASSSGAAATTPTSPAPSGSGTTGTVPGAYWPDARVKLVQSELNVLLTQAGCTTRTIAAGKSADGLIGPGTCGAIAWAKARGTPPATYAKYVTDFDKGCKQFTPKAPACPAETVAARATSLPFTVGVKDPTALKWQYLLNTELQVRGLPTVPEDGVFSPATCAGFGSFFRSYSAAPNSPPPADAFVDIVIQYQSPIVQACTLLAGRTETQPAAAAVLTAADVAAIQAGLNAEVLSPGGLLALPTDGKLSKATCGAANYAVSSVKAGKLSISAPLAALLNKASLQIGCDPLYPWTAPSKVAVAIAPAAIPAPTAAEVMLLQKLLNSEALAPGRFQPIPEDGRVSGLLCGTAGATRADVTAGKLRVSATLAGLLVSSSIRFACTKAGPISFPSRLPASSPPQVQVTPRLPAPARRSAQLPPLNRDGECVINAGQRYAEIGVLQQQLNAALASNGYKPIPVTNVWDAATCGALFAMGGRFSPQASSACPHFYSVPLSCPTVSTPTKIAATTPILVPKPPVPVKRASMALPLGIAAVVGVAAIVYAKKKGLIMAAKKTAVAT
jgi:hypothetical protein